MTPLPTDLKVDYTDADDPVLIRPDGSPIDTWRENYPYEHRMERKEYDWHKRLQQIELLKLQSWIKETGRRLVIVFEGRDAAGKGGTIKRFTEHLNPRGARVVALEKPTERERGQWTSARTTSTGASCGRPRCSSGCSWTTAWIC
jgi:polyphosphate kinase 2 (PPK2 family)